MIKEIHNFYYEEHVDQLVVEFSTEDDDDKFYRTQELDLDTLQYLLPPTFFDVSNWKEDFEEELIIEILTNYYKENDLPFQQLL